MTRLSLMLALIVLPRCGFAQSVPERQAASIQGFVTVSGMRFLDASGRPLLLHGINVVNKSKDQRYTGDLSPADFAAIRSWGMNCVRLAIFWDGLEPQPGRIDQEYLDRIARLVGYAKAQGLYVLLDMHQDLYSVKFSDGAPAWATLDEGKRHIGGTGATWSDAYYSSPAVQTALDHFWANSPGPDGVGLQEHYANVWQHVARRFRDEPDVIGYDLMNEPFPGQDAARVRQASLTRMAELLASRRGQKNLSSAKLAAMEATEAGRKQITEWLEDRRLFTCMLDAGTPIMQDFERTRLVPMYSRVRRAIRQVDSQHILFLEPAMSANLGIPSAIAPSVDEQGRRDPQQAYCPHVYDLVPDRELPSNAHIDLIFGRHAEFARRSQMPMLVGEWGAFGTNPDAGGSIRYTLHQADRLGCGDVYWAYRRELAHWPIILQALRREPLQRAVSAATGHLR